jgi:CheY-like chemotaxis protein
MVLMDLFIRVERCTTSPILGRRRVRERLGFEWGRKQRLHEASVNIDIIMSATARNGQATLNSGRTILVVDDEPLLRELTATVLGDLGYQVLQAGDGVVAVETWEKHGKPIDLLLTDVVMPRMNGGELASALSAKQPGLKVVFTSGSPREVVNDVLRDWMHAKLIPKPASLRDIQVCVSGVLA